MSSMKDQFVWELNHVVAKRNTCTEDTCNKSQRVDTSISGMYKHAQQQSNKWNRMHVYVTMFVSVCTSLPDRFIECHIHV